MGEQEDPAEFWDRRAPAWARHAEAMEPFARQFGDPAMDLLGAEPGHRIADVGCGPGLTTVELGRRVGPDGSVVGVDASAAMIEAAERHAAGAGPDNVRFEVADPGSGPIGSFDRIYSRFGVMFFDEPAPAFTNLRRSLLAGGRFVAVAWAELDANPWMFLPILVAAGPLEADLALPGPGEPGPFSLADPAEVTALLEGSGFGAVEVSRHEHAWRFGTDTANSSIAEMLSVGALGEAWTSASEDARAAAVEAVRVACDDHRDEDGFSLGAAALVYSVSVG